MSATTSSAIAINNKHNLLDTNESPHHKGSIKNEDMTIKGHLN